MNGLILRARWIAAVATMGFIALLISLPGCRRSTKLTSAPGGPSVVVDAGTDGGGGAGEDGGGSGDGAGSVGSQPPSHSIDEREPNDPFAKAMPIELPGDGGVRIRGSLASRASASPSTGVKAGTAAGAAHGDQDVYRLDAAATGAKRQLRVVLRPVLSEQGSGAGAPIAKADLVLDLLDSSGERELTINDAGPGETEVVPNVAAQSGHYLRVRALPAGAAAAYLLDLLTSPLGAGDEMEPNDRSAFATLLTVGGEADGYYGWRQDVDYYKVPLTEVPSGSVMRVDVDGVEGVAAAVAVFDSIESKLAEVKGERGLPLVVRSVAVRAGEPHCWVAVRALAGKSVDQRYSVRVATEIPVGPQELEPNDSATQSTLLGDSGAVTGYLLAGDQDWFRLKLPPGPQLVHAEVTSPDGTDLKLAAADGTGRIRLLVDAGTKREPEIIPGLLAEGELLFKVFGRPRDGNPDEPYRLSWSVAPSSAPFEVEPNEVVATATPWPTAPAGAPAAATELYGYLHPRGDVDCFRFTASGTPAPDGTVSESFTIDPIAKVRLGLALFDDQKRVLADSGTNPGASAGEAPRATANVKTGQRYFVCVRDVSGKASNPRDSYRLVRRAPSPTP